MMVSKKMRPFLLQIFWTGVNISYYAGLCVPIIVRQIPNLDQNEQL